MDNRLTDILPVVEEAVPAEDGFVERRSREPRSWHRINVYDLIQQEFKKGLADEIREAGQTYQEWPPGVYGPIQSGTVYRRSLFFRRHPHAAALGLYCDYFTLGDVKGM